MQFLTFIVTLNIPKQPFHKRLWLMMMYHQTWSQMDQNFGSAYPKRWPIFSSFGLLLSVVTSFATLSHIISTHALACMSHYTETKENTKAILKSCYVLHGYVGTIFSYDKLLAEQHPPSRNGDKSSDDGVWLGNKNVTHAIPSPYGMYLSMYNCIKYTWRPPRVFSWWTLHRLAT